MAGNAPLSTYLRMLVMYVCQKNTSPPMQAMRTGPKHALPPQDDDHRLASTTHWPLLAPARWEAISQLSNEQYALALRERVLAQLLQRAPKSSQLVQVRMGLANLRRERLQVPLPLAAVVF